MAKPILFMKVPQYAGIDGLERQRKHMQNHPVNNEYHVLIAFGDSATLMIECYNDCKGLSDVDIEKLIKEFNEH